MFATLHGKNGSLCLCALTMPFLKLIYKYICVFEVTFFKLFI